MQISATIRYEMTLKEYNDKGGDSYFITETSKALGIDKSLIKITSVKEGSVIATFTISSSGGTTLADKQKQLADVKATLDDAVKTGALNVYPGAVILNYESGIVTASNFPSFLS